MAAGDIVTNGDTGREDAFIEIATAAGGVAKALVVIQRSPTGAAATTAIDQSTPGSTNGVVAAPNTTGGLSIARLNTSAGANIKTTAGQIYGGIITNSNAAIRYLHLYNKASAAALTTDTPVATIPLPPSASVQVTTDGLGAAFSTGISWAFTTDDIAIPATAGATTDIHGTLFFK